MSVTSCFYQTCTGAAPLAAVAAPRTRVQQATIRQLFAVVFLRRFPTVRDEGNMPDMMFDSVFQGRRFANCKQPRPPRPPQHACRSGFAISFVTGSIVSFEHGISSEATLNCSRRTTLA